MIVMYGYGMVYGMLCCGIDVVLFDAVLYYFSQKVLI